MENRNNTIRFSWAEQDGSASTSDPANTLMQTSLTASISSITISTNTISSSAQLSFTGSTLSSSIVDARISSQHTNTVISNNISYSSELYYSSVYSGDVHSTTKASSSSNLTGTYDTSTKIWDPEITKLVSSETIAPNSSSSRLRNTTWTTLASLETARSTGLLPSLTGSETSKISSISKTSHVSASTHPSTHANKTSKSELSSISSYDTIATSSIPSISSISQSGIISSSSDMPYSVSENQVSIFYIYTQQYDFTDSTTSFTTGLPTTIAVAWTNENEVTTTFSVPQSTITTNASVYAMWVSGELGTSSSTEDTSSSKSNVGIIVGSVVGSVGGILLCFLLFWFIIFRRRRNKSNQSDFDKGFVHDIHNSINYSSTRSESFKKEYISPKKNNKNNINGNDSGISPNNPFKNESEFDNRGPLPIPLPRKKYSNNLLPNQRNSSNDNRSSYTISTSDSSMDSSMIDDFSTFSSTSIRLDPRNSSPFTNDNDNRHNSHPQGFFREII